MNKRFAIRAFLLSAVLLAGCGKGAAGSLEESGIILNKEQNIRQVIVESFDQSYYNADELKSQIEARISAGGQEEPIAVLDKFELSEEKLLRVELTYEKDDDYVAFNGTELFAGTVSEAQAAGYQIDSLSGTDGTVLSLGMLSSVSDKHIVVFEEPMAVVVPGKILYYSASVTLDSEKKAHKEGETEKGIVIYE